MLKKETIKCNAPITSPKILLVEENGWKNINTYRILKAKAKYLDLHWISRHGLKNME